MTPTPTFKIARPVSGSFDAPRIGRLDYDLAAGEHTATDDASRAVLEHVADRGHAKPVKPPKPTTTEPEESNS